MSLVFTPIGGLGQIGSNMMEVKLPSGKSFIIDCGILFPLEDTFNLKYLIPNYLEIQRPEAIFITHGHEDHIGALPHLLEHFSDLPFYASPFTGELIKRKSEFFPRKLNLNYRSIEHQPITIDSTEIYYIQVNHSIPETYGLLIKDNDSKVAFFYISDFKVDPKATLEKYFDFEKLKHIDLSGMKTVLMADSTNITSSNLKTPSEQDLVPAFQKYFSQSNQRVFATTFSSNIHRIYNLVTEATKAGRKPVLYGRSMLNYWDVAKQTELFPYFPRVFEVSEIDPQEDQLLVIVSGCQGDFRGTFRRICYGNDTYFKPQSEDLFLLSSKPIPGNEKAISLCLNELSKNDSQIITSGDALIHASGHAGKEDILEVIKNFKPDVFIPIHGESYFLAKHKNWVEGLPNSPRVYELSNFDSFDLEKEKFQPNEEKEPILVSGKSLFVSRDSIKERRKLAEGGLVIVSIFPDKTNTTLKVETSGISYPDTLPESHFTKNIVHIVQKNTKHRKNTKEEIRIKTRKLFVDLLGQKPVVVVTHPNWD